MVTPVVPDDLIIVGNKDNDVKVESHEFQKDEK